MADVAIPHPFEREQGPRDRIALRGHVVEADVGAFEAERGRPQRLRFDVVAEVEPTAGAGDDVDRVLSYDRLAEAVAAALSRERVDLLETLAERVAEGVLASPQAARVFVRVEKLDRGPGALGVEIVREAGAAGRRGEVSVPRPTLACLPGEAVGAPGLPALLERLGARGPLVLSVGPPGTPAPRSPDPDAQRRIDLLALDQAAWSLAGRTPGCVVGSSRTELDWALRRGHAAIWAPARLAPAALGSDAPALAAWLADLLDAERVVVVGEAPRPPTDRPTERATIGPALARADDAS